MKSRSQARVFYYLSRIFVDYADRLHNDCVVLHTESPQQHCGVLFPSDLSLTLRSMPANKNALIRYKTIDNCLSNHYRRWTIDDLVEACSEALYDCEGISRGVSVRTVQADLQMMRSDKLGYNAPIEVYDHKYYRYADPDYSITAMPLSKNDLEGLRQAVDMLRQLQDFDQFVELSDVVSRLEEKLALTGKKKSPIVHFDNVPNLKGLKWLGPLYAHIRHRQTLCIAYQSFTAREPHEFVICPHLLKEFRNRWFLYGTRQNDLQIYNLALDRIIDIRPSDSPYRDNPNFDPAHYFDDVVGVTKNAGLEPQRIKIWTSAEQSDYILTKPIHPSQRLLSRGKDGSSVFEIRVVVNVELYSVLMSYGPGVKVMSPKFVARHMRDRLNEACKMYDE